MARVVAPSLATSVHSDVFVKRFVYILHMRLNLTRLQVFSGNRPFHNLREFAIIVAVVLDQKRPCRPPDEICTMTGLDCEMWHLIEDCWRQLPADHPTTTEIVERLCSRVGRIDEQSLSDWDNSFTSRLRSALIQHSNEPETVFPFRVHLRTNRRAYTDTSEDSSSASPSITESPPPSDSSIVTQHHRERNSFAVFDSDFVVGSGYQYVNELRRGAYDCTITAKHQSSGESCAIRKIEHVRHNVRFDDAYYCTSTPLN
jgi:hypothetical protein